jgi:hypothetical protein
MGVAIVHHFFRLKCAKPQQNCLNTLEAWHKLLLMPGRGHYTVKESDIPGETTVWDV